MLGNPGTSPLVSRYGSAVVLVGLAVLASLLLAPYWSPRHLLLPFYPAVMLSAWLGGLGPGLLTTVLSALAIDYFWLPPTPAFGIREPGDVMGFVLFLAVGILVSTLNARLLAAQRRAVAAAAGFRREMTQRQEAEATAAKLAKLSEELRRSVERYGQQFERNIAGVFRATRDGRVVECSDALARLLGVRSPADVLKLDVREFLIDRADWTALVASLAPGVVISNHELGCRRADGTPLTVLVNARAAEDLVEGVAVDITDRKRAEAAERQAMQLRGVADVANAAAHEINNPLTIVVAHLELLRLEGEPAARVEKALDAARRIQDILDRMTRISRVEVTRESSPALPRMLDIRKSSD